MHAICVGLIVIGLVSALPSRAQEGTASLTGRVIDTTGASVAGTAAELHSESESGRTFQATADETGTYYFSGLPKGVYTIRLFSPGFRLFSLGAIPIAGGEQKSMPPLKLQISMGCGPGVGLETLRYLPMAVQSGDVRGAVTVDRGPMEGNTPGVAGANVTLICGNGQICGRTKTNAKGQFLFKNLSPGNASIRVSRAGYYPLSEQGYAIEEGLESVYYPVHLERCARGNCDPRLRPRKPIGSCE